MLIQRTPYDKQTLPLCHTTTLNAWDRIQELRKIIESYAMAKQGQRKHFSDFIQRLIKAFQIGETDPEAR